MGGEKSGSPFAKLAGLRDALPAGPTPEATAAAGAPPADARFRGKIVVAKTKRGRGGKTVTLVTGIAGGDLVLQDLARTLQRTLGCGGTVEDGAVALQGDQVDRAIAWLEENGARRVIRGTR